MWFVTVYIHLWDSNWKGWIPNIFRICMGIPLAPILVLVAEYFLRGLISDVAFLKTVSSGICFIGVLLFGAVINKIESYLENNICDSWWGNPDPWWNLLIILLGAIVSLFGLFSIFLYQALLFAF